MWGLTISRQVRYIKRELLCELLFGFSSNNSRKRSEAIYSRLTQNECWKQMGRLNSSNLKECESSLQAYDRDRKTFIPTN